MACAGADASPAAQPCEALFPEERGVCGAERGPLGAAEHFGTYSPPVALETGSPTSNSSARRRSPLTGLMGDEKLMFDLHGIPVALAGLLPLPSGGGLYGAADRPCGASLSCCCTSAPSCIPVQRALLLRCRRAVACRQIRARGFVWGAPEPPKPGWRRGSSVKQPASRATKVAISVLFRV